MEQAAANPGARILVVDDDPSILDVVATALRFLNFTTAVAESGSQALTLAEEQRPDLIVLDVMLPDMEGFSVADRLAARGDRVPILFLTARDAPDDRLRGLGVGDDYVTKPFSLEELVARIRAILRRAGVTSVASSILRYEDLTLDEETRDVMRGDVAIELTATEFRLLRYFLANPRRVLTRQQILDHVWEYDFGGDGRILETYVSYLRKKLDVQGPPLIQTVRGVGYALREARGS